MEKILEVFDLKKSYGSVQAVKGISFYVEKGGLFAFLGPNGAGKSTTIDILCTLLAPDSGTATIDGHTISKEDDKIRSKIGVVFQDSLLDPLLTVKENLSLRGGLYGLPRTELNRSLEQAAQWTDVTEFLHRPYGKLSGGQRRRADIARALINKPTMLFLDEPTTGLDPQTRKSIWQTIRKLQQENNMTVFLTTHYMEEASDADYVIVIDDGLIAAKGTPAELRMRYSSDLLKLRGKSAAALKTHLDERKLRYTQHGNLFALPLSDTLEALPILDDCRALLENVEIMNGSMDDAFIGITGKEIRS